MRRAVKMCDTCPFRLKLSRAERIELAALTPEEFQCHTEAGYTETDIQCRGHWQVRHKFAKAEEADAAANSYSSVEDTHSHPTARRVEMARLVERIKRKRKRRLQAKPGELIAYYGYDRDGEGPDLCVAWGGDGAERADSRCLLEALAANVYGDLPFFKELEARGYDLSTLKFTVRQKVQATDLIPREA